MDRLNNMTPAPLTCRLRLIAAAIVICVVVATAVLGCTPHPVPTPDEMRARYAEHKVDFDRIAQLAESDADLAAYKQSVDAIGARQVDLYEGEPILVFESTGLAVSGVEWGYYYSSTATPLSEQDSGYESTSVGDGWFAYVYRF